MKNPIKALIGRNSSDEARAALAKRQTDLAKVEAALADAEARLDAAIEADADAGMVKKIDAEMLALAREKDTAAKFVAAGEKRLAEAEAAEQAEREADAATALDKRLKGDRVEIAEAMAEYSRVALRALIAMAEGQIETDRLAKVAARDWSERSYEIALRGIDGREQIVSSKDVELWVDRLGRPLAEQPRIVNGDGEGGHYVPVPVERQGYMNAGSNRIPVFQKRFRREEFYPRNPEASWPDPLAEALFLPPIVGGRPPIWNGPRMRGCSPDEVINNARAALDRVDAQLGELRSGQLDRGAPETRLIALD